MPTLVLFLCVMVICCQCKACNESMRYCMHLKSCKLTSLELNPNLSVIFLCNACVTIRKMKNNLQGVERSCLTQKIPFYLLKKIILLFVKLYITYLVTNFI
uniref:Secreted protein n=1 Tax=Cacopsylla melanoneura TaxID=428564 RepID=A0A8D8UDH1_9HEMI